MNKKDRIKTLKSFGQAANPTVPNPNQTINIRSVPNFRDQLFSARPDIINDMNIIVNIINKNLLALSNNVVSFNIVWNNPSIDGSQFSNSIKNLLSIAKWIYNVIKSQTSAYSIDGLKAIGAGLINTVKSYSFPEPNASSIQYELLIAGQNILSKL